MPHHGEAQQRSAERALPQEVERQVPRPPQGQDLVQPGDARIKKEEKDKTKEASFKAVKEQQIIIEAEKAKTATLEAKVATLEAETAAKEAAKKEEKEAEEDAARKAGFPKSEEGVRQMYAAKAEAAKKEKEEAATAETAKKAETELKKMQEDGARRKMSRKSGKIVLLSDENNDEDNDDDSDDDSDDDNDEDNDEDNELNRKKSGIKRFKYKIKSHLENMWKIINLIEKLKPTSKQQKGGSSPDKIARDSAIEYWNQFNMIVGEVENLLEILDSETDKDAKSSINTIKKELENIISSKDTVVSPENYRFNLRNLKSKIGEINNITEKITKEVKKQALEKYKSTSEDGKCTRDKFSLHINMANAKGDKKLGEIIMNSGIDNEKDIMYTGGEALVALTSKINSGGNDDSKSGSLFGGKSSKKSKKKSSKKSKKKSSKANKAKNANKAKKEKNVKKANNAKKEKNANKAKNVKKAKKTKRMKSRQRKGVKQTKKRR